MMYFNVFYNKYKITWRLSKFQKPKSIEIITRILKETKDTTLISYGNFLCKDNDDLNIIYEILMEESLNNKKEKELSLANSPNLLYESIKYFIETY